MTNNLSCNINSYNDTLEIIGDVDNLSWIDFNVKVRNGAFDDYLTFIGYNDSLKSARFNSTSWNPIKGDVFTILVIHINESRIFFEKDV